MKTEEKNEGFFVRGCEDVSSSCDLLEDLMEVEVVVIVVVDLREARMCLGMGGILA